ncbi:MAG: low-density lipoprotein receptor class A repeat-containing protein, partial [Candidatus Thermoplasmatota archaeon]|nr:low-density lipoprotein receptor class A repeat-containing protein [Candidatus Thermoplasmatota archaeon]
DWFLCESYDRIPFQYVNDGKQDCEDADDEHETRQSGNFYCDGYATNLDFALVNDGTADCADGADEGEAIFQLVNIYANDGMGNVLVSVDDVMLCASWNCDISMSVDSGFVNYESEVPTPSTYGEMDVCTGATIYDADGTVLATVEETCNSIWIGGPEISEWGTYMNDNGEDSLALHVTAEDWDGSYSDVTVTYAVNEMTDNGPVTVATESVAFNGESSVEFDRIVDISNPGEYCLDVTLMQDGETEPFDTHQDCVTVEEGPEVSERMEKIAGALADSGLSNVMENFGQNLASTFEELDEDYEVPVFPYNDGMWAPLWSNEHATIVGVGVYAWDEDGDAYVIAGPETTGYSQDLPMTFASIRYITGVPAQEAQTEMAGFDDLEDIVDVENHDLSELAADLQEAGADTTDLGLGDGTDNGGETTDDGEQTAEDIAEDAGLLPFTSPLTVMALIGLAALAGHRRHEHE